MQHRLVGMCVVSLVSAAACSGAIIEIAPARDNTIYTDAGGNNSNALGTAIFAGTNAGSNIRRALISFDIAAAIPAGSAISSVSLRLNNTAANLDAHSISLHRLTTNWGEGTSIAGGAQGSGVAASVGDATWNNAFHPATPWAAAGGDFAAAASASQSVTGAGQYLWSSAQLVGDVESFLAAPGGNFGWIIRGGEGAPSTAKRFSSREEPEAGLRPALIVEYTIPGPGACTILIGGMLCATTRRRHARSREL